MKRYVGVLLVLFALTQAALAAASTQIKGASPSARKEIHLYAQPKAPAPVTQIETATLQFPIPILETKSGYSKISLEGKEYWVNNSQVRLQRQSSAKCAPRPRRMAQGLSAATPGISERACQGNAKP